jgi:threonine synthase
VCALSSGGRVFVCFCVLLGMDVSDPSFLPRVQDIFISACASDTDITAVIDSVHSSTGYTVCPHTAAGVYAVNTVGKSAGPIITMATAHPGKFRASLDAIASPVVPECLKGLLDRPRRCVDLPNDVKAVQAFIDAQPV